MMKLKYIQASAGSGKTYTIENDVADKLSYGELLPHELIAVTFTRDAAEELKGRISQTLISRNQLQLAAGVMTSRIGTIHSVFGQLLSDFAFELGLSPMQRVLDDLDKQQVLSEAIESSLSLDDMATLNQLASRLSVEDWREDMLKIIEHMRSNGMEPSKVDEFAAQSMDKLLSHLPRARDSVTELALKEALYQAVVVAKKETKPTKGLLTVIDKAEKLLRKETFSWQDWVTVSKFKPTKMGQQIFADAMMLAFDVLKSPDFQQDMLSFIRALFNAARAAMEEFAELKKVRGLLDFVDQENLALAALQNPFVQKQLKEQVRYLIIDEFQDTSPLQLALFSTLSEMVDDVLMVGDAKQAIYGFRGSDPKLTLDVLNYVTQHGDVDTLNHSWRSRPGLVELTNELFTAPFSHLLDAEQVSLSSKVEYTLPTYELGWWTLAFEGRKSSEKTLSALVEGIKQHIRSGTQVWNKQDKQHRNATWRDMAVLCRSNKEASDLANYCGRAGIPVSLERVGLVETPEVSLALACLRRLIDGSDSLASAEIIALSTGDGPESWLEDRLDAVQNGMTREWADGAHPVLEKLSAARANMQLFSTKEALNIALLTADVAGIVTQWREGAKLTEHRIGNLAKLNQLVDEYESHCQSHFLAATPTGFILWLKQLEQGFNDRQAANNGDAVTITTYHRSKGLEWPIVICSSLDTPVKVSLFGSRIVDDGSVPFNWQEPLLGRSLNYWPNPFPAQRGKDPLTAILDHTTEWQQAQSRAYNEALQLLYVGITRARDQLILTTEGTADTIGSWLQQLNSSVLPPKGEYLELPDGNRVKTDMQTWTMPDEVEPNFDCRNRHWFSPVLPQSEPKEHLYFQPPSKSKAMGNANCRVLHNFGSRISINGKPEMDKLGDLLHHCFALTLANQNFSTDSIDTLIKSQLPGVIQTDEVIQRSLDLLDWIATQYPQAKLHTELPFSMVLESGSLRQGEIDLVVETEDGWVVIDHKSNPQPANEWAGIALKYSGQLEAYKRALETLTGKPVLSTLIHFSVSGGLVEVKTDSVESS